MVMPIFLKRFRSIVHMLYDIGFHAYVGVSVSFFYKKKLFSLVFFNFLLLLLFFYNYFPFLFFRERGEWGEWGALGSPSKSNARGKFFYDIVRWQGVIETSLTTHKEPLLRPLLLCTNHITITKINCENFGPYTYCFIELLTDPIS